MEIEENCKSLLITFDYLVSFQIFLMCVTSCFNLKNCVYFKFGLFDSQFISCCSILNIDF